VYWQINTLKTSPVDVTTMSRKILMLRYSPERKEVLYEKCYYNKEV
jgi:hypothetical protein